MKVATALHHEVQELRKIASEERSSRDRSNPMSEQRLTLSDEIRSMQRELSLAQSEFRSKDFLLSEAATEVAQYQSASMMNESKLKQEVTIWIHEARDEEHHLQQEVARAEHRNEIFKDEAVMVEEQRIQAIKYRDSAIHTESVIALERDNTKAELKRVAGDVWISPPKCRKRVEPQP